MNKQEVMKALAICGGINRVGCEECPYYGVESCDARMNNDAIALLNSEPEHNSKPAYHTAYIYTKHDNLSKWFDVNCSKFIVDGNMEYSAHFVRAEAHYAQERIVKLVILVRHEAGKCICRIKCPINPLPIKGEFETTAAADVGRLIMSMGWNFSHKIELNSPLYK